jgi:hypothetical protein
MAWNKQHYEEVKRQVEQNIACGKKTAYCYMKEYEQMIEKEDYEGAKAITEILLPLGYDTAQTHNQINRLQ